MNIDLTVPELRVQGILEGAWHDVCKLLSDQGVFLCGVWVESGFGAKLFHRISFRIGSKDLKQSLC